MADTEVSASPARRIVTWLRAGYPSGVPRTDYAALLTLLHRRLAPEEIESIASDLSAAAAPDSPICEDEIVAAIRDHTHQRPGADDISRVRSHLAMGGWPLSALEEEVAHETTPDEESVTEDDPEGNDPR